VIAVPAAAQPFIDWQWIADHLSEIWAATVEHVRLAVIAVAVGFVLAAVLTVVALRWRWTFTPITWIVGILYTIPSLALFTLLVPVFGLGSIWAAEVALVSYTLLILVRNNVAGIDGVPRAAVDAADGMGFTRWRRLLRVELPLATPVIIAGVRIATVTTIGLVTVTALIGLGGYGDLINDGLDRQFLTPIIVGGTLSVLMAVVLDVALVALERVLTPWRTARPRRMVEPPNLPVGGVALEPTVEAEVGAS
jgi:osmoprotectant transport system permease protein